MTSPSVRTEVGARDRTLVTFVAWCLAFASGTVGLGEPPSVPVSQRLGEEGPQGPPGPEGPQGPAGPQGEPGPPSRGLLAGQYIPGGGLDMYVSLGGGANEQSADLPDLGFMFYPAGPGTVDGKAFVVLPEACPFTIRLAVMSEGNITDTPLGVEVNVGQSGVLPFTDGPVTIDADDTIALHVVVTEFCSPES